MSHSYRYTDSETEIRGETQTSIDGESSTTTTGICRARSWHGSFEDLVAEQVSEIKSVIAAELDAAGHADDELALCIARKVVLKQLDVTDLDGSE